MKNLTKIFMMVAAGMLAFSCVTDATEDLGVTIGNGEGQATITVTIGDPDTKVQFGTKDGETYPLYWNEGDAISVQQDAEFCTSTSLTGVAEDAKTATFTFGDLSAFNMANYVHVLYPVHTEDLDTSLRATTFTFVIPAEQQYCEGGVDPKALVLYGVKEKNADLSSIQMKSAVGVLRIAVKGNGEVLKGLTVETLKEAKINAAGGDDNGIAGAFICFTSTSNAHKSGGRIVSTRTITMVLPEEGLTLGEEEQVIYVAVRGIGSGVEGQANHGEMKVTLTDADGKQMEVTFDTTNKPIKAGVVREFAPITFTPNVDNGGDEPVEGGELVINDEADLVMFAKNAANYTKATVTNNLDMNNVSAEYLAYFPIEGFGAAEFDGGNYTIDNLTTPLFGTTEATIKNVNLTNVNINETTRAISGAIACQINGGSLENCSASGNLTISAIPSDATELKYAGLVGVMTGESITNCTNNVNVSCTATNIALNLEIGGVVSTFTGSMNTVTNNGHISFTGTSSKSLYIGGVLNTGAGDQTYTACNNNGNICVDGESEESKASVDVCHLGGIIYNGAITATFDNCHNCGKFTIGDNSKVLRSCYIGGVFGLYNVMVTTTLRGCSNSGDITVSGAITANKSGYNYIGGLLPELNVTKTTLSIKDGFINSGKITVSLNPDVTLERPLVIGGLIGECSAAFYNTDWSGTIANTGTITFKGNTSFSFRVGGLFGKYKQTGADIVASETLSIINTGNIIVEGTRTGTNEDGIGGLVGVQTGTATKISGAQVYCDIYVAKDDNTNVGMFIGIMKSGQKNYTNCQVGGRIATTGETVETEEIPELRDDEGNLIEPGVPAQTVVVPTWIKLDDSNWFQYIYSTAVEESVATGDGCELLQSAPTVE